MKGLIRALFDKRNRSLKEAIAQDAFLVDVRSPEEFAGGSVKGAVNIPVKELSRQWEQFKGKDCIIVFCSMGVRAAKAKKMLEVHGFRPVINGKTWKKVKEVMDNLSK